MYKDILIIFCLLLSLVNLLIDIKREIVGMSNFRSYFEVLKDSSLIRWRLDQGENYSLLDLILDLRYSLKFGRKPLISCLVFFLLFKIFFFLPLTYISIFFFGFFYNISRIVLAWFYSSEVCMITLPFSPFSSWKCLIKCFLVLPINWSFCVIYCMLGLKRGKFRLSDIQMLTYQLVLSRPLWYLKFLVKQVIFLTEIYTLKFWKGKHYTVWPIIINKALKLHLYNALNESYRTLFSITSNSRIYWEGGRLRLNPDGLVEYIRHMAWQKQPVISKPYLVFVGGTYHQVYLDKSLKYGMVFTHSHNVFIDKISADTSAYGSNLEGQRYLFSAVDLGLLKHKKGYNLSLFNKMNLYNYESYVGMLLRIEILHQTEISKNFCLQALDNSMNILLKCGLTQEQIYTGALPTETTFLKKELILKNLARLTYMDIKVKKHEQILNELYRTTDVVLYRKVRHESLVWFADYEASIKNPLKNREYVSESNNFMSWKNII